MSDSVNEGIVLLVAPDFADQESCIQNQSRNDQEEKYDAENKEGHLAPVENDPTHVQSDGDRDQACAERYEKCD